MQRRGQSRTGPPGQRDRDTRQHRPQQRRSPPVPHRHPLDLLHESPELTGRLIAEPPPNPKSDHHPPERRPSGARTGCAPWSPRTRKTCRSQPPPTQTPGYTPRPRPRQHPRWPPGPGAEAAGAHHDQHTASTDRNTQAPCRAQAPNITKSGSNPNYDVVCSADSGVAEWLDTRR
jgi:hypothetical protein